MPAPAPVLPPPAQAAVEVHDAPLSAAEARALESIVDLHEQGIATEHEAWCCADLNEYDVLNRSQAWISKGGGPDLQQLLDETAERDACVLQASSAQL